MRSCGNFRCCGGGTSGLGTRAAWERNRPVPKFYFLMEARAHQVSYIPPPSLLQKLHKGCPHRAQPVPVGHWWELGEAAFFSRQLQPPQDFTHPPAVVLVTLERCRGVIRTEFEKTLHPKARGLGPSSRSATDWTLQTFGLLSGSECSRLGRGYKINSLPEPDSVIHGARFAVWEEGLRSWRMGKSAHLFLSLFFSFLLLLGLRDLQKAEAR